MNKKFFNIIAIIAVSLQVSAQQDKIVSAVYHWEKPRVNESNNIRSSILFEGKANDMDWLQLSANELATSGYALNITVPVTEEHLYIVKSGTLNIAISDTINYLTPGSIALLMPEQRFWIQNKQNLPCEYYVMKYRSNSPVDKERGRNSGGSIVKEWNKIEFRPHDRGGIRNYFERATAMCKRMEMHVTTLNGGIKSHDPHIHKAEEIVLMIEGNTEMQIGQQFYRGKNGSVYFLGSNILHAIRNEDDKPCLYFAFQFE